MPRTATGVFVTSLIIFSFALTGRSEKVCQGTENGLSRNQDLSQHYNQYRSQYLGCTHINGNLELVGFEEEHDMSFLQDILEIRGYLLIGTFKQAQAPLPNLRIIRGSTLFKGYSLYIVSTDIQELQFTSLKEIQYGDVYIGGNSRLCYYNTIDWHDLLLPEINGFILEHQIHIESNNRDPNRCSACNETCNGHCWGSGPNMCQELTQNSCHAVCEYRCNGPEPADCCHRSCAAGCTGSTNSECLACQEYNDEGKCVDDCPPPTIYNPNTFLNEDNPNFKYTFGSQCIEQCPESSVIDDFKCVRSCPNGKYAYDDSNCVECDGPCPLTCKGTDSYSSNNYVTANNIDSFKNCTEIDGNIVINSYLFKGDPWAGIPKLDDLSKLDYFSNIWRITGYLKVQASGPVHIQKDLSMFRSLREISGRQLYQAAYALDVSITSLEMLGLASLEEISLGSVVISGNVYMCYLNIPMWDSIAKNPTQPHNIGYNKPSQNCSNEGKVCHEECAVDGCWGPGSDMCISCHNYKLGDECVGTCDVNNGQYIVSSTECSMCDIECLGNCKGAGPGNCTACKHVTDGPYCRVECPLDKYPDAGNNCTACHPNCVDGCTGPENIVGEGGCNICQKVYLDREKNILYCMEKGDENIISCPNNTFSQHIDDHLNGKAEEACQECHDQCLTCYGPNNYHCYECLNKRLGSGDGSTCLQECPIDHYSEGIECKPCHAQCKDRCHGPNPDQCDACKFKKIDFGDTFWCVDSCRGAHPYILDDECVSECRGLTYGMTDPVGDMYCSACSSQCLEGCHNGTQQGCFACRHVQQGSFCQANCDLGFIFNEDLICMPFDPESDPTGISNGDRIGIIVGALVAFIFFIVIIIIVVYIKKKRQFYDIPTDYPLEQLDLKTLTPSGAAPNRSTLRLIKETELKKGVILGSGAFGTVYKGLWVPEGDRVRIPVAIKVLREGMSAESSKELLEEAYVMATVDHPCLVRLLCVCMAQQMMMVTQLMPCGSLLDYIRANKSKVSSHHLLTWCTQIARGMRYLEEMRLVHRDLAARNVLVKNPAQVKITDFGLSKFLDIHEEEYKAEGGKVAIKWMALECIQYRRFTHQSDVWSYGVTVWELMTFGGRPYEHARARDVPDLLEKGERLPQPQICTIDVYMVMLKCWLLDADTRPSFKELAEDFSKMAKDPQRYLVILNDGQEPLPSPTKSEFYSSLLPEGGHESLMDAEDYLQPVITNLDMDRRRSGDAVDSVPPSTDYQMARQSLRTPPQVPYVAGINTLDVADDSSSATSTPMVRRGDPNQEYRPQFLDRQLSAASAGGASAGASNKGSKLFHSPNGERKDRYCSDPLTVLQSQRSRDDSSPKAIPEEDIDGYLAPQLMGEADEEPMETNRLMESDEEDAFEPPSQAWNIVENPEYMNQGAAGNQGYQPPSGRPRSPPGNRAPNGRVRGATPSYGNLPPPTKMSHLKPEYVNYNLQVLPPLERRSQESLNLSAAHSDQSLSKLSDALSDDLSDHEYVNDLPQVRLKGLGGQSSA